MKDPLKIFEKLKTKVSKYRIWKETGITNPTMLLWEKNVYRPNAASAKKLKELLDKLNEK